MTVRVAPGGARCSCRRRTLRGVSRRWTDDSIRRELEAFLPGWDVWPSYTAFRSTGRRGLWQAIVHRGGPVRFAEEYGLPYTRNGRVFSDAEIRARLRATLRGSDLAAWPSRSWLKARAGADLVSAIDRAGGAARWARQLGIPLLHRPGHRWTPETAAAALDALLAVRRTWPSRREFEAAGLGGLYHAITATLGHAELSAHYGLPLQRPPRRRKAPRRSPPWLFPE
jgi:hypothetical protein